MATFQENNSGLDSQACKRSVNCPPLKVHGIHCKAKLPERRKWWPWAGRGVEINETLGKYASTSLSSCKEPASQMFPLSCGIVPPLVKAYSREAPEAEALTKVTQGRSGVDRSGPWLFTTGHRGLWAGRGEEMGGCSQKSWQLVGKVVHSLR